MAPTIQPAASAQSEPQDQPDPVLDLHHGEDRKGTNPLQKELPVEGRKLRHVDHEGLAQSGPARSAGDVAGGPGQLQVGRQRGHNHGAYPALVERVSLYDEDGAPQAGARTPKWTEVDPPQFAAPDNQRERRRVTRAAFSRKDSLSCGALPQTAFNRSETSCPSACFR